MSVQSNEVHYVSESLFKISNSLGQHTPIPECKTEIGEHTDSAYVFFKSCYFKSSQSYEISVNNDFTRKPENKESAYITLGIA